LRAFDWRGRRRRRRRRRRCNVMSIYLSFYSPAGGFKTGWDIIQGALMGAEEFGFGTFAMIAAGW